MAEDPSSRKARRYREDLADAIEAFLDFSADHQALAAGIAREGAERAVPPVRGRAGRGRKLTLDERAELAARAVIRHRHTDYEDALGALGTSAYWDDEALYEEARAQAQAAVDEFLARHRRRS